MTRNASFILICGIVSSLSFASIAHARAMGASVREFGAVGDGKTDDSGAFQRAIDSGRGDIFVPRGRYRFEKTVVADLDRAGPLSIASMAGRDLQAQNLAGNRGRDTEDIRTYSKECYNVNGIVRVAHSHRFLLDFCMNETDTMIVENILNLIYSPSDMPRGLWRGFAFSGSTAKGMHHAC